MNLCWKESFEYRKCKRTSVRYLIDVTELILERNVTVQKCLRELYQAPRLSHKGLKLNFSVYKSKSIIILIAIAVVVLWFVIGTYGIFIFI